MEEAPLYPQLTCPKPHHSTQPLMFVCLDYKCDNHTPICYSCKKEAHANHTTEDIGFFFKKLNEELTSRDLKEVEALLAKLGNLRQYCLEILRKERQHINQLFQQLESFIGGTCESLTEKITAEASKLRASIERNAKVMQPKHYDQFSQSIELNVENYHRNLLCEKELLAEAFLIIRNVQSSSREVEQSLGKIVNEAVRLNDQLTKAFGNNFQFSFDRLFPTIQSKYRWSDKLKFKAIDLKNGHAQIGKDINILARGLTTVKFIKQQVGVLMDNPLADKRQLAYIWKVKVSKLQYTINFGMCLRKKAIATEFQRHKWEEFGHGHYLIGQDKVVFSHSDSEVNCKPLSFTFKEQEIVTIQYDTVSRIITFSKGQERFQMSVVPAPEDDCYYPCAYLTRTDNIFKNGESVQIIQQVPMMG